MKCTHCSLIRVLTSLLTGTTIASCADVLSVRHVFQNQVIHGEGKLAIFSANVRGEGVCDVCRERHTRG